LLGAMAISMRPRGLPPEWKGTPLPVPAGQPLIGVVNRFQLAGQLLAGMVVL